MTTQPSRPRKKAAPCTPHFLPYAEPLEERNLLNNRFVVPANLADNVANFATLQDALTTPGLNSGDVIQIQHDSVPGTLVSAAIPAVANLTVQGEPGYNSANIPAFTIQASVIIGTAQAGFTLTGVNLV